ncbi:MAG TPA: phosphoribosyltransferase family protein [Gemmatimonadales bacterium]|nr:phosphoribosyltransferase family protein [Gemmatimonadales bacterium]
MPRPRPTPTRDTLDIDWPFFGELCRALAVKVARTYDPEVVVGVAKAGAIPAAIVATILRRDLVTVTIARPDAEAAPSLLVPPPASLRGRRVLVVDETCDSGDTLKLALQAVRDRGPADVRTAVSFRTGEWQPDFWAFETAKVIVLPWDREVIEDGELVPRLDLPG